eukprot:11184067-Lingulodinium_polyedra.AAC.1
MQVLENVERFANTKRQVSGSMGPKKYRPGRPILLFLFGNYLLPDGGRFGGGGRFAGCRNLGCAFSGRAIV